MAHRKRRGPPPRPREPLFPVIPKWEPKNVSRQRQINEALAASTAGTPRMLCGPAWCKEHHILAVRAEDFGEWAALESFQWGGILAGGD